MTQYSTLHTTVPPTQAEITKLIITYTQPDNIRCAACNGLMTTTVEGEKGEHITDQCKTCGGTEKAVV